MPTAQDGYTTPRPFELLKVCCPCGREIDLTLSATDIATYGGVANAHCASRFLSDPAETGGCGWADWVVTGRRL